MGREARLRGTRDERVAAAIKRKEDAALARQKARDLIDRAAQEEIARRWAAMTPEEREARLEKAKSEIALHGELSDMVGFDAATALLNVITIRDKK